MRHTLLPDYFAALFLSALTPISGAATLPDAANVLDQAAPVNVPVAEKSLAESAKEIKQSVDEIKQVEERLKKLRDAIESDNGKPNGDHLTLKAAIRNVSLLEDKNPSKGDKNLIKYYCVPDKSTIRIKQYTSDGFASFSIVKLGGANGANKKKSDKLTVDEPIKSTMEDSADSTKKNPVEPTKLISECSLDGTQQTAKIGFQYKVSIEQISSISTERSGVRFGGLVIPFKYYMGSGSSVKASPTLAPYISWSCGSQRGVEFSPFVSAGLGLVPINNVDGDTTNTETALSVAIGLLLRSEKNDSWSSGLVLG